MPEEGVQPPFGSSLGVIDDKGRLKVTTPFQMFMEAHPSWFATSIGDEMLRFYPLASWRRFRDALRAQGEEGEDIAFNADRTGYEVNVDAHGRVLTPPEWRKCHSMNRIEVEMYWNRDHILVSTRDQARAARAVGSDVA